MVEIGISKLSYTFESLVFKWGVGKNCNELWEKMGPVQSEIIWFLMYKNTSALQGLTSQAQSIEDAYMRAERQGIFCCSELQF